MKDSTKKIIAREFLFLLGTIILFFVVIFIWASLNDSINDKEYELKQEIKSLTEYKKLPYRLRVFYYINNNIIEYSWDKMKDSEKFISDLKENEYASEIYDYIKKKRNIEIDKEQYLKLISKDTVSEQYLTKLLPKLLPLEKKLDKIKDSFFNHSVGGDEALGLGILIFSIFFLLRYLIYATKWSIRQLKK